MITTQPLAVSPATQLSQLGWAWMLGTDTLPYLPNEAVTLTSGEAEAYEAAANELFDLYVQAAQHVIDHNRFAELGIPPALIESIRESWNADELHLYGRFDLAGGLDGKPIKLIEFNADTATCLPETAVVQYAHLRANGLDDSRQFNAVFETLTAQFDELLALNPNRQPTLLLSAMRDFPEDDANVALLGEAAKEAGFEVRFGFVDEVEFSTEEGIFWQNPRNGHFEPMDFWFRLLPWEVIADEEPELLAILIEIMRHRRAVILNPPYTLLFQSKGILPVLWELFPNHPLLLEADFKPLAGKPCVEKVLFGREGANIRLLDANGQVAQAADGTYGAYDRIYQQYVEFVEDAAGHCYQAGVFYAGAACGLGFRRGGRIIDNTAEFVGHIILP